MIICIYCGCSAREVQRLNETSGAPGPDPICCEVVYPDQALERAMALLEEKLTALRIHYLTLHARVLERLADRIERELLNGV